MKPRSNYEKAYDTLISIYHDNDLLVNELHDLKVLVDRAVPKRVNARYDGYGDSSIPNGAYLFYTYHCPNERCDEVLDDDIAPNYCPRCGQRLQWRCVDE